MILVISTLLIPDRGSSGGGNRRRSSSRHRREARQRWKDETRMKFKILYLNFRRELSLSSHSTPDQGRESRVTRYREEKRRHRGGIGTRDLKDTCRGHMSDSTDSEGEDKRTRGSQDKLSYTEYKRRRRLRDVNRSLSKIYFFRRVKI